MFSTLLLWIVTYSAMPEQTFLLLPNYNLVPTYQISFPFTPTSIRSTWIYFNLSVIFFVYIFSCELSIQSFCPFLVELFIFLLLSFKSHLNILVGFCLSYISFSNFFSESVACLLFLLIVFFLAEDILLLMKSSFLFYFFHGSCLW
jgi:hypothetical protein